MQNAEGKAPGTFSVREALFCPLSSPVAFCVPGQFFEREKKKRKDVFAVEISFNKPFGFRVQDFVVGLYKGSLPRSLLACPVQGRGGGAFPWIEPRQESHRRGSPRMAAYANIGPVGCDTFLHKINRQDVD